MHAGKYPPILQTSIKIYERLLEKKVAKITASALNLPKK